MEKTIGLLPIFLLSIHCADNHLLIAKKGQNMVRNQFTKFLEVVSFPHNFAVETKQVD